MLDLSKETKRKIERKMTEKSATIKYLINFFNNRQEEKFKK